MIQEVMMQVQLTRYAGLSLALAVSTTLGACKSERRAPAVSETAGGNVAAPVGTDTASSSGAVDTTGAMSADTTAMGGNASGGMADLSDANFAALMDEVDEADSTAGALAAEKGTDASVKAFGRRMMADHHAMRRQGAQVVKQLNITMELPQNDPVKQLATQEMSDLQAAQQGAAFDSTYIAHEVKVHQAVLGLLDAVQNNAESEELKGLAQKAQPIIQSHLDRAQTIQKTLTSAS
jgi:putative membrane protein